MSDEQAGVSLNLGGDAPQSPQPEANQANQDPVPVIQPEPVAEPQVQVEPVPVAQPEAVVSAPQVVESAPVTQAQDTLLYSSEDPSNNQVDLDQAGFNLNIEQKVPATEAELPSKNGAIVDNIVSQTTVNKEQEDKILKELEKMDSSIELDAPVSPIEERKVKTARRVFFGVLFTALAVLAYVFFSPSTGGASLGKSALEPLAEQKQGLTEARSELIASHYYIADTALKSAAEYTAKLAVDYDTSVSNFAGFNERTKAEGNLDDHRDSIQDAIKIAEKEIAEAKKLTLEEDSASSDLLLHLSTKESETASLSEKQKFQGALGLYRNDQILGQIKNLNFDADTSELLDQLQPIMAGLKTNDLGRLAHVQTKRISWSQIISELESVTQEVDPGLDSITYNGYTFDAEQNRVTVTGQIQTEDEKTFTLITELIDSINEPDSPFMNASNTSFAKNASEENGFTSSIRLDFNLK